MNVFSSLNKKHYVIAFVVIWIVIIGVGLKRCIFHTAALDQDKFQVISLASGPIEETVTSQGKLEAKEYVDVGAQVSGQLKKVYVDIGDVIESGHLIAEIDARVYQSKVEADAARLKSLQAQLAEQQAQVVLAQQQFERNQRLIKTHAVSQEALEVALATYKAAQAKHTSLKAQAEEAESTLAGDQANLSYTKIYAPISGTVVLKNAVEGQTLNASQTAPTIVQIANLDVMTVRAQVSEADVMRLKPGMPVYFTTLGRLEQKWHGTIRQILPSPETINDVVLYNVLIDAENPNRELMIGMSVQLFFLIGEAENAVLIPIQALGKRSAAEDNDSGTAYQVKQYQDGDISEKTIHIGYMNRTMAQVRAGLEAGDQVVIAIQAASPKDKKQSGGGQPPGPRL